MVQTQHARNICVTQIDDEHSWTSLRDWLAQVVWSHQDLKFFQLGLLTAVVFNPPPFQPSFLNFKVCKSKEKLWNKEQKT